MSRRCVGYAVWIAPHTANVHDLSADGLAAEALDQSHDLIAVLDAAGSIVLTNAAWRAGADKRGGGAATDCGANYLEVCDLSGASAVAHGIRAVLRGDQPRFEFEYPCHSPVDDAWFVVEVSPLSGTGSGVVVTHADVTARMSHSALQDSRDFDPVTMLATAPVEETGVAQLLSDAQARGLSLAVVTITLREIGKIEARYGRRFRDEVIIRAAARVLRLAHEDVALIRPTANQLVLFATVTDDHGGTLLRETIAQALESGYLIWSAEVQSAADVVVELTDQSSTLDSLLAASAEYGDGLGIQSMADKITRLEGHIRRIGSEVHAADIAVNVGSAVDRTSSALNSLNLTARQKEIVQRLAEGQRVPSIAAALYISRSTVRNHLANVYRIVGVHSQDELLSVLQTS